MRIRIALLVIIGIFTTVAAIAQTNNGETPTTAELQLTATQLIADATDTAEAFNGTATPTDTPDSFVLTATALVIQATQTAEGNGSIPVPATVSGNQFELTATQIIMEATATAQSGGITSSIADDDESQALNITILAIGLVIFALIIIGGGYIVLNSRDEQKLKP